MAIHDVRFPHESDAYRAARNELLRAEMDLVQRQEEVARLRRALPVGGTVDDYVFQSMDPRGATRDVRLSQLFATGPTLVVYNFMFGPNAMQPCPMCTSMLDALDGNAQHIAQVTNLAVVARSPIER